LGYKEKGRIVLAEDERKEAKPGLKTKYEIRRN
jgi:hypothetical protein